MHAILAPVRALAPASARRVTPTARSQRRRVAVGRTAANAGPIVALGASVSAGDANVVDAKHARAVSEVAARWRTEEEGAAPATRAGEEEEELDATETDSTAVAATALFAAFAFAFFAGVDPLTSGDVGSTTGAGSDLQQATSMARNMVAKYGMSETLGPIFLSDRELEKLSPATRAHPPQDRGRPRGELVVVPRDVVNALGGR